MKKGERKVIATKEVELTSDNRLHKSWVLASKALTQIAEEAGRGDKTAAEHLVDLATYAANLLFIVERQNPDLFKTLAQNLMQWPIAGTDEHGWEKEASMRFAKLCLGSNLWIFKIRFRQARGTDANLPARRWAKAAVRVIEATHLRLFTLSEAKRHFGSSGAFADFCITANWDIGQRNGLDHIAKLLLLSRQSFPEWKPVVRQIIREDVPDFHIHPDWTTQRNTAEQSGRNSKGEVQNAILDDITSALFRLIPNEPC